MKQIIRKERVYLFAPSTCVATVVTIKKANIHTSDLEALKKAIQIAVDKNEILHSNISIEKDGSAFYKTEVSDMPINVSITVSNSGWEQIVSEQTKIRFSIENGETIRFYLLPDENTIQLLILSHHLVGDGLSISYLVEDIMNALIGREIPFRPIQLLTNPGNHPKAVPFITRFMLRGLNKSWKKSEVLFSFADSQRIFNQYWKEHRIHVCSEVIEENALNGLLDFCKQNNVTLNSLLLTVLFQVQPENTDIGVSVNLRDADHIHTMGNYATAVTANSLQRKDICFTDQVKNVHQQFYRCLDNEKKKYFLMQFMDEISDTLIDASFFSVYDNFDNRFAGMASKMFGYQHHPEGVGFSNLTRVPIASQYGDYQLWNYGCVPPLFSNLKRMFGASTISNRLTLTYCIADDESLTKEIARFDLLIQSLKEVLCSLGIS